ALNACVLLLHDGMHGTLARSRRANRWASVGLGAVALMSFTAYRVLHLRHHTHLGGTLDPDDYYNYTKRRWLVWTLHYVRLFAGTFLYVLLIPVFAYRYGSRSDRRALVTEYALL